jgi:hypothetical protein
MIHHATLPFKLLLLLLLHNCFLQGYWTDDTALNAIQASCASRNGTQMATGLIPGGGGGNYGSW